MLFIFTYSTRTAHVAVCIAYHDPFVPLLRLEARCFLLDSVSVVKYFVQVWQA